MAKENLAEKPENYDITAEVKASTVMSETEVQETITSNSNDNMEGLQTPPKGDTTDAEDVADPQQWIKAQKQIILTGDNLPECIKDLSLDEIFENASSHLKNWRS